MVKCRDSGTRKAICKISELQQHVLLAAVPSYFYVLGKLPARGGSSLPARGGSSSNTMPPDSSGGLDAFRTVIQDPSPVLSFKIWGRYGEGTVRSCQGGVFWGSVHNPLEGYTHATAGPLGNAVVLHCCSSLFYTTDPTIVLSTASSWCGYLGQRRCGSIPCDQSSSTCELELDTRKAAAAVFLVSIFKSPSSWQ